MSQLITGVHVYEPTNSKFTSYDIDAQGRIYFGGYVRPHNFTMDTIGNVSYVGYWYEDGMTCRTDSTGFIDWITITGNANGLEDTKSIRYWNGSVFSAGIFIASGGQILVNNVAVPFTYPCCYNGYVMRQSETGGFDWLFSLPTNSYDLEVDNAGNCYVTGEGYLKKINSSGTELWTVPYVPFYTEILLQNDTVYLFGIFQDSVLISGNTLVAYGPQYDVDSYMSRYTSSGSFIDVVHIGSPTWDVVHDIASDANGNIWISGFTGDSSFVGTNGICGTGSRCYFAKLDNNTLQPQYCDYFPIIRQWSSDLTGELIFNSANERIATLNMHDTLVIGTDTLSFEDYGGYEGACVLVKWDAAGNPVWHRVLATPTSTQMDGASVSAHIRKTLNGKYLLAGQMRSPCQIDGNTYNQIHYYEAFFASLTDSTYTTGISSLEEENIDVSFENPASESMTISCMIRPTRISVYNVLGEIILIEKPNGLSTTFDISLLKPGTYYFNIEFGETNLVRKFIKI